jgi:hypothetical protein
MTKIITLLIAIIGMMPIGLYAQRTCGSDLNVAEIQILDLPRYNAIQQLEQLTSTYVSQLKSGSNERIVDPNATIIIPVVVHVLHNGVQIGTGRNISDAQIASQIVVLNEDFRRQNANAANTPAAFLPIAADPRIEFRLAQIDPNGNPTNGITRTSTPYATYNLVRNVNKSINETATRIKFTSQGGKDAWATNRYLNIWVCDLGAGLLGYAQFPFDFASKPDTDGVVIDFQCFGRIGNLMQDFNLGRTTTHEIGHWLNLRHIWGDSDCGNDQCSDTPPQKSYNFGCPTFPLVRANPSMGWYGPRCNSNDISSMFMNYMDYTNDACMNVYTVNQRDRMRALFMRGGVRETFIENIFRINSSPPNICLGETTTISLLNISGIPVVWTVEGSAIISSGQNTNQITITGVSNGFATVTASSGNYIDTKTIWIGAPSIPSDIIGFSHNGKYFGSNSYYDFHAQPSINQGTNQYQWVVGGGTIVDGQETERISVLTFQAGEMQIYFDVSLRVNNSCGWSPWLWRTGYIESGVGPAYVIYPNPAREEVFVTINEYRVSKENGTKKKQIKTIRIIDKMGSTALIRNFSNNVTDINLNISSLPKGIYVIIINETESHTLIKE